MKKAILFTSATIFLISIFLPGIFAMQIANSTPPEFSIAFTTARNGQSVGDRITIAPSQTFFAEVWLRHVDHEQTGNFDPIVQISLEMSFDPSQLEVVAVYEPTMAESLLFLSGLNMQPLPGNTAHHPTLSGRVNQMIFVTTPTLDAQPNGRLVTLAFRALDPIIGAQSMIDFHADTEILTESGEPMAQDYPLFSLGHVRTLLLGDVNRDGVFCVCDTVWIRELAIHQLMPGRLTPTQIAGLDLDAADMNRNGSIGQTDLLIALMQLGVNDYRDVCVVHG